VTFQIGLRRSARTAATSTVLVLVLVIALAVPAAAIPATVMSTEQLAPGLRLQHIEVRLGDGQIARGTVLRWNASDAGIQLRPHLAKGAIAGLDTMPSMAHRELRRGAIAGVNGGYFVQRPVGAPNGAYVSRGQLLSSPSVGVSGGRYEPSRGTLGIRPDGRLLFDRLSITTTLDLPGTAKPGAYSINEINRQPRCPAAGDVTCPETGEVLLYDPSFGARVRAPSGSTLVTLDAERIPASGSHRAAVLTRRVQGTASEVDVPAGQLLLVGHGPARGPRLAALSVGDVVTLNVELRPADAPGTSWADLDHAVPGAPLLLRSGERLPAILPATTDRQLTEMLSVSHRIDRHPRTAVGQTATGENLLIVIDGRQMGWSVGATLLELTRILESMGVTDAVNMDGGGPAGMMAHGSWVSRPAQPDRGHANGLFVFTPRRTWYLRNSLSAGAANSTAVFGFTNDRVLACDWNGDGVDTPAAFSNGRWVISNRPDGAGKLAILTYGRRGDIPACGDWNGDGRDTVGVRRGKEFLLRNANSAGPVSIRFAFGRKSDVPVVGDWNGNGRDTIGVRRENRFLLRNANSAGTPSLDFAFGRATDIPLVGDWNGNGRDTIGVRRQTRVLLRNANAAGVPSHDYAFGRSRDSPVTGNFNGKIGDSVGVVR
jgi:hypothetical protein